MSAHWYVLAIKPHKERSVYRLLQTKDIRVYFPALKVKPKNPRAAKVRPYFPGYMFVQVNLDEEGENALRWIPGTRGLVSFGGRPATVPDNLIQELKKRLALLEAAKAEQLSDLEPGDRVRIIEGPFAGYEAIFDAHLSGKERVQILLAYLSYHPHRITLGADSIEKLKS